jgi:AcrR family transcriptional regulator
MRLRRNQMARPSPGPTNCAAATRLSDSITVLLGSFMMIALECSNCITVYSGLMPVKSRRTRPPSSRARTGRVAQKRRTRKAIVDAAAALLARGNTPTVNEVAAAADVSRRTVFLYFPTFDQLLLDATVGALSEAPVQDALDRAPRGDDPAAGVERLVRALNHVTPDMERLGRSLIRLTVEKPAAGSATGMPRRGYRRIHWIESALAPWSGHIDPDRRHRLVCALAMVVGWEALIVQRDVCGLNAADGEELSVWAARALVHATLGDTREPRRAQRRGRR